MCFDTPTPNSNFRTTTQAHTMKMMYKRIATAILNAGIEVHPTDYLQVRRRGGLTAG